MLTRARQWTLCRAGWIQYITPHIISLRSILILSYHLRLCLPSGLFPPSFPTSTLHALLSSPICAISIPHRILLNVIILITCNRLLITQLSSSSNYYIPIGSKFSSQHLVLEQSRSVFPPWRQITSLTPIKIAKNIRVFFFFLYFSLYVFRQDRRKPSE